MKKQTGFSLIEIAVVLVIMGIILTTVVGSLTNRLQGAKISSTQDTLKQVKIALKGFYRLNKRLPCPAIVRGKLGATAATSMGREDPSTPSGTCTEKFGFVPNADLGVRGELDENNLLLDAWGMPILYGVSDYDSTNTTAPCSPNPNSNSNYDFVTRDEVNLDCATLPLEPLRYVPPPSISTNFFQIHSIKSDCSDSPVPVSKNIPVLFFSRGKNGRSGPYSAVETRNININDTVLTAMDYKISRTKHSRPKGACGNFDDIFEWISTLEIMDLN